MVFPSGNSALNAGNIPRVAGSSESAGSNPFDNSFFIPSSEGTSAEDEQHWNQLAVMGMGFSVLESVVSLFKRGDSPSTTPNG